MSKVSVYLNFPGTCEEAFNFYKGIFGGEFEGGIARFKDMPPSADSAEVPAPAENQVLHVALPILGGFMLMGSDAPESMGFRLTAGNNTYINLETDSKEETDRLFSALSEGGEITMPLQDMFWGAYFGSCTDRFGIQWMVNCAAK